LQKNIIFLVINSDEVIMGAEALAGLVFGWGFYEITAELDKALDPRDEVLGSGYEKEAQIREKAYYNEYCIEKFTRYCGFTLKVMGVCINALSGATLPMCLERDKDSDSRPIGPATTAASTLLATGFCCVGVGNLLVKLGTTTARAYLKSQENRAQIAQIQQ
jgi:hypothetical protein